MNGGQYMPVIILTIAILGVLSCSIAVGTSDGLNIFKHGELSILTYNVENLFDTTHDGTEYSSFVPGDDWNLSLYQQKRAKIVEVLESAEPDIIALQEIENDQVVQDIQELLGTRKYPYRMVSNFPHSAIQLGCISRFPIVDVYTHAVSVEFHTGLRGILELHIQNNDLDMIFFINHWKSQRSGESSQKIRNEQANLLYSRVQTLHQAGKRHMILLGDFNEDFTDDGRAFVLPHAWDGQGIPLVHDVESVMDGRFAYQEGEVGVPAVLFYSPLSMRSQGSYLYRNHWEKLDGIFLSLSLMEVFSLEEYDYLNTEGMSDTSGAPLSWHRNPDNRGYSDHFPAYVSLRRN